MTSVHFCGYCARHGLSQERLALQLGCHRIHVYRLEHGSRHPSRVLLRALRHTPLLNLAAADYDWLGHFELLLEYHCDAIEVSTSPHYLPLNGSQSQAHQMLGRAHRAASGG
jgi:transcriptional regulator with XRE-family HTH domain